MKLNVVAYLIKEGYEEADVINPKKQKKGEVHLPFFQKSTCVITVDGYKTWVLRLN
ncbi:hypothetical protein P4S59_19685 [Vibrio sp. M60_M70]